MFSAAFNSSSTIDSNTPSTADVLNTVITTDPRRSSAVSVISNDPPTISSRITKSTKGTKNSGMTKNTKASTTATERQSRGGIIQSVENMMYRHDSERKSRTALESPSYKNNILERSRKDPLFQDSERVGTLPTIQSSHPDSQRISTIGSSLTSKFCHETASAPVPSQRRMVDPPSDNLLGVPRDSSRRTNSTRTTRSSYKNYGQQMHMGHPWNEAEFTKAHPSSKSIHTAKTFRTAESAKTANQSYVTDIMSSAQDIFNATFGTGTGSKKNPSSQVPMQMHQVHQDERQPRSYHSRAQTIPQGSSLHSRDMSVVVPQRSRYTGDPQDWWGSQAAGTLINRCMKAYGWPSKYAQSVLVGYYQFLELKKNMTDWDADQLIPSIPVDQMWQQHVLDVVNYVHDTTHLCGQVVGRDHDGKCNPEERIRQIEATKIALRARFGNFIDEDVWDFGIDVSRGTFSNMRERAIPTIREVHEAYNMPRYTTPQFSAPIYADEPTVHSTADGTVAEFLGFDPMKIWNGMMNSNEKAPASKPAPTRVKESTSSHSRISIPHSRGSNSRSSNKRSSSHSRGNPVSPSNVFPPSLLNGQAQQHSSSRFSLF